MIEFLFIVLGLFGLWIGSQLVIKAAINIARHFRISDIFMGLTILAFGTDLPELTVVVTGSIHKLFIQDTSDLIIGEAIGTCFGQIGLALGIAGLFGVMLVKKSNLLRDGFMLVTSILLLFLAGLDGVLSRIEGVSFIVIYIFYFFLLFREERIKEKIQKSSEFHPFWSTISLIGGFAVIIISSNLTVESSVSLSETLGVSQSIIGIMLVGLGTSLPELAVAISAVREKANAMAVGNIIGSNIFDILLTLGIGATISTFNYNKDLLYYDTPALLIFTVAVLLLFRYKMRVTKKEAVVILAMYLSYIVLKFTVIPGTFIEH
jgi:cation:H+ antiporter